MKQILKFGVLGTSGLATLISLGTLPAQEPPPPPPVVSGVPGATETRVLVAHAVELAIGATSTQLAARSLATLPDREKGQGKGALDALRDQASETYDNGRKTFEEAREGLDQVPGDTRGRQLYEAAVSYTEALWKLAGEAAPVDEPKAKVGPTGELNPVDLAALHVINNAVRQAADAYLLEPRRPARPRGQPVARRPTQAPGPDGLGRQERLGEVPESGRETAR